MKVRCTTNSLSELYLTAYHRAVLGRFVDKAHPVWQAEVGKTYTVYAISIIQSFPFYCVTVPRGWGDRWGRIPSLCFETVDPRLSSYWRFETRVARSGGNEVISTTFAIPEWIDEPMFLENLVDNREREVAIMADAVEKMEAEFL